MKKISVDLDDELVEKIEGMATDGFRSFSDQVRKILHEYGEEVKEEN